jgi:hypothetical protein
LKSTKGSYSLVLLLPLAMIDTCDAASTGDNLFKLHRTEDDYFYYRFDEQSETGYLSIELTLYRDKVSKCEVLYRKKTDDAGINASKNPVPTTLLPKH